jgi:hypothetical protein
MRLIDGDKLQEFPIRANHCDKEHANTHFINGIESVMEYAAHLPTVDAEVVVRCKDCRKFKTYACRYDDFCSYGERKEGADNG